MVYDDPLSKKSLKESPNWPPSKWISENYMGWEQDFIEKKLTQMNFNFEEWLKYKISVPHDNRPRPHHHSEVEYPLTDEELQAFKDKLVLCSPVLCPKQWKEYSKKWDEVNKRFWWLGMQENWVQLGFPSPPEIVWHSNNYILKTFVHLIYNPFIKYWGNQPDDFWIKLSYKLEQENQSFLLRAFVLFFYSQEKVFPAPDLYEDIEGTNSESLFLPQEFWNQ